MASGSENGCMTTIRCVSQHDESISLAVLKSIKFNFMTSMDIERNSSAEIVEVGDLSSPKLGLPNPLSVCETCGSRADSYNEYCDGHFGMIKLPSVIYHPYFLSEAVQILNQMCPGCKSVRHNMHMKGSLSSRVLRISTDELQLERIYNALPDVQKKLLRKLIPSSKILKARSIIKKRAGKQLANRDSRYSHLGCKYCYNQRLSNEWYPRVKFKMMKDKPGSRSSSIVAEVSAKLPKRLRHRNPNEVLAKDYWDFVPRNGHESESCDRTKMVLSPWQAFHLLKELHPEFIEKYVPRRELLFLSCLPVTSNSHRVTEVTLPHVNGPQLIFDSRTAAYRSLLSSKKRIDDLQLHLHTCSTGISKIIANHSFNCLSSSNLQASGSAGKMLDSTKSGSKWIKNVVLGKRSDHTFNMIVVGDPKIRLCEIGIPCDVSGRLVVADCVTAFNNEKLKRGCKLQLFNKKETFSKSRSVSSKFTSAPKIADIIYRPLEDGDIVLIYRPPSVHKHSHIALRVKILPSNSVLSINPLCCAPLKGDFDGDILFGYIPQSVQCRVELDQLVGLDCQLINGQDGRSLLSLSHDSLTAAYLLTGTDVFLNKFEMQQLQMICGQKLKFPAILKSSSSQISPIWTGRQLFSSLLPNNLDFAIAPEVHISKGEVLVSPTESFWLKNTNDGLYSTLFKCYGNKALDILFSAQEVLCEWLSSRGFSVSLHDLYICSDKYSRRKMVDEVGCGLQHAKHAFRIRSLILDPELMNFHNDYDECQNLSYVMGYNMDCVKHIKLNSGSMKLHSLAAFKEVFQDIQTIVHPFACKENSLLQMIHAGSKGSYTKLFQQCVCLGLQPSLNFLSSAIPREHFYGFWKQHMPVDLDGVPLDTVDCEGGNYCYPIIESSFLDGLDPHQCLLHAKSARANFFSENAELPGTLSQKLMFHMRDLYIAYDGTVRNFYGQQVVQFSCDTPESSSSSPSSDITHKFFDNSYDAHGLGGQPAGVLASSAISEAAYGGLDQPTAGKSSPIMNLKKVFNSCQKKNSAAGQTISLALSKKLKRWNYGFEYAALEVQRHLERVLLSDITSTVLIVYSGQQVTESVCPWILHFHLDKQRMLQRKVTLPYIIDTFEKKYNSAEEMVDKVSCRLNFLSKKCLLNDDGAAGNDMVCLSVIAESSDFVTNFDDIKDILVPFLLRTVIKGFKEYNKVEILWDDESNSPRLHKGSSGELFVKVSLSKYCTRKVWSDIQCACIPIMGLIDWERSHPDSACEIHNSHGIESARNFFLKILKAATTDLGRSINEQHLRLVADCLTATGKFTGLSPRGITFQRKYFNISSPFMQGCSFRPANTFINAAKLGAVDKLLGTVDAMAWGMEPPVGTGGSFDILYSGKLYNRDKNENIYHALVGNPIHQKDDTSVERPYLSDKLESWPPFENISHGSGKLSGKFFSDEDQKEHVGLLDKVIKKQNAHTDSATEVVAMYGRLQNILHGNPINSSLNVQDASYVKDVLHFHPESEAKIGIGIQEIKIGYHPSYPMSRCFFVVRKDGSMEDFSFKKCVVGVSKKKITGITMLEKRCIRKH